MPFAEDVGLEGHEFLHGFAPAADVGLEARQERTVDVLAEKDSLSAPVQVDGHGTGGVPGRVEKVQLFGAELQGFVVCLEADIDRGGREIRFIPVGRRHDGVAFLDGIGILVVGGQFAAKIFPEPRRRADVIDVAVREDDRGDLLRVEARALNVADKRPGAAAGPGIYHDELATEIDDEGRGILRHGDVRPAHKPDTVDDQLCFAHLSLPDFST